ncbi:hypothetical protein O3G_MSEX010425 [Manduca sexta]|uniref:Uncharacterized protein n=2 Tax=Manduca sexta TaxID=7130 RepID=A0A921ZJ98_MANSE|nr:hypothetical protein O3G_MSEX010425 [Manduca sexta]
MTKTYDSTLTGIINITEDIPDGWSVKATMQKCQDIRNVETCDYFKSFYLVRSGCGADSDEDREMYSLLFHYTAPRISCPLRAGTHKLNHYPVFTEDNYLTVYEAKISTSVFGYTFRLDGAGADGRKIFCVDAYLQLVYLRPHNWLAKNGTNKNNTHNSKEDD